jgi:hypothetical protein
MSTALVPCWSYRKCKQNSRWNAVYERLGGVFGKGVSGLSYKKNRFR